MVPSVLCEALSRRLGRTVTLDELGFAVQLLSSHAALDWGADTLITLTDLGRVDLDMERRRILAAATYSVAALAVPEHRLTLTPDGTHQSRHPTQPIT